MAKIQTSSVAIFLFLISLPLAYLTTSKSTQFSLKLIPVDSLDHSLYTRNLTQIERIQRFVDFSQAKANYLESLLTQKASMELDNIRLQVYKRNSLYAVSVNIGTPNKVVLLLMDTGSGLIWTQCTTPGAIHSAYNPRKSVTYRKLPSNHTLCRPPFRRVIGECAYDLWYGGGAFTRGVVSIETFKFRSNGNTFKSFQNMLFGCSHYVQNFSFDASSRIAGVMGLSLSPLSLVSQLNHVINRKFSYCLVFDRTEIAAVTSVLRFGEDIVIRGRNVQQTPFVRHNIRPDLYYLNLSDISVGGHRIGFAPGTFSIRDNGTGGFFIDSGAIISIIDRVPYKRVKRIFQTHFDRFNLERVFNVSEELDLCYKFRSNFSEYIPMTFHFQGASFTVESQYMYFFDKMRRYFCLALMSKNGLTILGSWQQQDKRIVYDLGIGALRFVPANCSLDRL